MLTKLLNGKTLSEKIQKEIFLEVKNNLLLGKRPPGLAVILIGNDVVSKIYVKKKQDICKKIGFSFYLYKLKDNVDEKTLLKLINELNKNRKIDGILIQFPLPKKFNYIKISESINPKKDVDGFHPNNIGLLCQKAPRLRPCTSFGIITLLKKYKIKLSGLNAVIVGSSNIVGRPMFLELLLAGCTPTITHRLTHNLRDYIEKADLLIVAIGNPNFIPGSWIKIGAIVIDVGINRLKNGIITGDIVFNEALSRASWITPVPGGVGPMTVASLMQNTLKSYYDNYLFP